jgi:hypothetical protein
MRPKSPPAHIRDFMPPHCPFPDCEAHTIPEGTLFLFQRRGYRRTDRKPGWVRRFFCKHCERFFSSSCFTGDYWKRVTGVDEAIYLGLANGQALRQIARSRKLSLGLVRRRERWLARQCLLWHELLLKELEGKLDEPVALDGFRTFAMSQYEPLDLNTPVTTRSGFVLDLRAAPARRSGRMSDAQKARREQRDLWLGTPARDVRVKASGQSLRLIDRLAAPGKTVELRTDEEPDYARALEQEALGERFEHVTVSSRELRTRANPLWRINQLHAMLRHSLKSHTRETLAFHKRLRGLMDRAVVARLWLNVTKGISERSGRAAKITPAMVLGLVSEPLRGAELFGKRLFPGRVGLPEELREIYEGTIKARPREPLRVEPLRYAY